MSVWLLGTLGVVFAGALVLWHETGRNKQLGILMLRKYEELLAQARVEKERALREAEEDDEKHETGDTSEEPSEAAH